MLRAPLTTTRKKSVTRRSRVRKQVYELTVTDLTRHPVWEFALDEEGRKGQDEATVRPYKPRGGLDPGDGMFVVRAWLTLADGTRVRGHLQPQVPGTPFSRNNHPTAVVADGQVGFWCGMRAPTKREIVEDYARLGKASAREVFPLRFESDVTLIGGPVRGKVPGFLVLENFRTMRTRVVK